ncbi:hypothetical protein AB0N81_37175 [Streptomyces sp. NPDC093510]|uniref:hypothetical protein n=1 Tax=Streptomyces sp. NPDC093510 TaxID=3155199 RepID=UPI00341A54AC
MVLSVEGDDAADGDGITDAHVTALDACTEMIESIHDLLLVSPHQVGQAVAAVGEAVNQIYMSLTAIADGSAEEQDLDRLARNLTQQGAEMSHIMRMSLQESHFYRHIVPGEER